MQCDRMRRRDVIALFGSAALLAPGTAGAQAAPVPVPVVGWLSVGQPRPVNLVAVQQGLSEQGFVVGRNVAFEIRAGDDFGDLPRMAADLVSRRVAVIFTQAGANSARAAKAATSTIPIVFTLGNDPIRAGLVTSLNRPGGNLTGATFLAGELGPKRLELARELVPQADTIGIMTNPGNFIAAADEAAMQAAAAGIKQKIVSLHASTAAEIDAAFATAAQQRVGALILNGDAYFSSRADQIIALAARHAIPTLYYNPLFVAGGGLMSYSGDIAEAGHQAGLYIGRILKGEKPADLPVVQSTKFDFVINLKAAKALGLEFPPSFQVRATEVIE